MSEEAEWWQSVAMIAGWPEWQIMPKDSKKRSSEKPKIKKIKKTKSSIGFAP